MVGILKNNIQFTRSRQAIFRIMEATVAIVVRNIGFGFKHIMMVEKRVIHINLVQ